MYDSFETVKLYRLKPEPKLHRPIVSWSMSEYENVVGGKLKLKGKALDVKAGGLKKKKKQKKHFDEIIEVKGNELSTVGSTGMSDTSEAINEANQSGGDGNVTTHDDNLTPAERRYIEQRERIELRRLAKTSNKSHRDRIQDFNQYLANLSSLFSTASQPKGAMAYLVSILSKHLLKTRPGLLHQLHGWEPRALGTQVWELISSLAA
ncbi:hypothetical protein NE237_022483 [Protea cynaroides]|uniref:Uncharacterized protein n=1 Tax=Protea cynaroides TaxID=273540 RepID=A0A9Q0HF83_9MAGN|nr:hypothetical protein NE237_022483 [Protea cynaroides]